MVDDVNQRVSIVVKSNVNYLYLVEQIILLVKGNITTDRY